MARVYLPHLGTYTNILITAILITVSINTGCGSIIVHYTTPGAVSGDQVQVAGLWRGTIDTNDLVANNGRAINSLRDPDFICAEYKTTFKTGLAIDSLSIDWATHDVVLRWNEDYDRTRTTLLRGDICDPQPDCINTDRLKLLKYDASPGIPDHYTRAETGAIQPVLTWESDIYFLYTPSLDKAVHFGYQPQLEFRRLTECTPEDVRNHNLVVDHCSVLLANLSAPSGERWMEAGSMLYAVADTNDDNINTKSNISSRPTFFTTVRLALYPDPPVNTTLLEHHFALVGIRETAAGVTEARILHQESLWSGWYGHGLRELGGISYRDGVLCWTAVDRVLCGRWAPADGLTAPRDVRVVVAPGDAALACHTGGHEIYWNVTTGVAIIDTSPDGDRLSLMFGCSTDLVDRGGMGFVSVNRRRGTKNIIKITDAAGPILAGMIFVTDDDFCGQKTTTSTRDPRPSGTAVTSPTSGAPCSSWHIWMVGAVFVTTLKTMHTPT